ncbi:MAG: putative Ig domain-containing protein [Planctomycetota bacterium]
MDRIRLTALAILTLLTFAACGSSDGTDRKLTRLGITNTSLPTGTIGVAYTAQLSGIGGTSPYTYGVVGALPSGLSLDTATGTISGTPTAAFNGDIEFTITDANPYTVSTLLSLQLTTPPALNLTSNLSAGFTGTPYTGSLQGVGGVVPYSYFISTGQLPAGLTLDTSSGAIAGTPAIAGASALTFGVMDAAGQQELTTATIEIHMGVTVASPTSLPAAFIGADWYSRIDASGGLPPYQFTLTGAPAWIQSATIGDGWLELTGVPANAGTASFVVEVTDSNGTTAQSQVSTQVQVPATAVQGDSQVVTTSLPRAVAGEYFQADVNATGGFAPYYWSAMGLPEGMYFDAGVTSPGVLRGRPRAAGVYTLSLSADDGVHNCIRSSFEFVVEPSLSALPEATTGTDYSTQSDVIFGGTYAGIQVTSSPSSLGLTCGATPTTLQLYGTPTAAGRAVFALSISLGGNDITKLVGTNVRAAPASLQVITTQLPAAVAGSAYDYAALIQAEGGSGTGYQWSLVSGTLPPGINGLPAFGPEAAMLTGTTTQSGSYQFTVQVSDSTSATAQATLTIDVVEPTRGDFNGDGCPDLLLGSEFSSNLGGVKLFYGEPSHPRFGTIGMEDADWTYAGTIDVCSFGDFNGDGVSDVVVGNRAAQGAPAKVKIWFGSRKTPLFGTATTPDCEIADATTTDQLGSAIAAGDLDNDGYDDLVLGARRADTSVADAGNVYVFYGGATALSGALAVSSADAVFAGKVAGSDNTYWGYPATGYLGDSLVVEDLDGDGRDDIVAGASSTVFVVYSKSSRHTGSQDISSIADATFGGLVGSVLVGRLTVGDFNGDSRTDLVVGGLHSYIFYGKSTGLPLSGTSDAGGSSAEFVMPSSSSTSLYVGVAAVDLNDDGFDDIAFATPENALGFVFYGSSTKLTGMVDYANADIHFNFGGNDYAPWFVTRLDANNDGVDDLMMGIHNMTGSTAAGPVYTAGGAAVINGSATNPPQGAVTPASGNGLKFMGQLQNHGWGGCGAGG